MVTAPLLALWGAKGVVGHLYDVLATWREKAATVTRPGARLRTYAAGGSARSAASRADPLLGRTCLACAERELAQALDLGGQRRRAGGDAAFAEQAVVADEIGGKAAGLLDQDQAGEAVPGRSSAG